MLIYESKRWYRPQAPAAEGSGSCRCVGDQSRPSIPLDAERHPAHSAHIAVGARAPRWPVGLDCAEHTAVGRGCRMNSPPAARPTSTPTRADGQRIELRTHIGDLVRTVPMAVGEELFTAGLVNQVGDHLCLKPHVRWIPAPASPPGLR